MAAWLLALLFATGCGGDAEDTGAEDVGIGYDAGDVEPQVNACGGDAELSFNGEPAAVGDSCGACGDGELACDGLDVLVCEGAGELNACGGCAELDGTPDGICDHPDSESAVWQCASEEEVRCVATHENACGGSSELDDQPLDPCGPCLADTYECDGAEAVVCNGDSACPEYLSSDITVTDVGESTATLNAELDTLPPVEVEDHGFCWDTAPDPASDDANCTTLGLADTDGAFWLEVDTLEPGVEYFVQAFATTAAGDVYSDEISFLTLALAPTGVMGVPANKRVIVEWDVPSYAGASSITGYTATAAPGGGSCSTSLGSQETSCTVDGAFDQDIGGWDISNVTSMLYMFYNASLSTANYDALLIGWESNPNGVQRDVFFDAGSSQFTSGGAADNARSSLIINEGWSISDGGRAP